MGDEPHLAIQLNPPNLTRGGIIANFAASHKGNDFTAMGVSDRPLNTWSTIGKYLLLWVLIANTKAGL